MTRVTCAQLRYTWAERRLEGAGGGFGVVARSADWPAELLEDPVTREILTSIDADLRQEPAETAATSVAHRRWRRGSLLVAKRPVGQDGAGRPGNYAVHALFDASATLGSLDLAPLVAGGTFVLERDVDVEPSADAPAVTVWARSDWRADGALPQPGVGGVGAGREYGDSPLDYRDPAAVPELLGGLCLRLPADLVNQLEVSRTRSTALKQTAPDPTATEPTTAGPTASGDVDRLIALFAEAVSLGAIDQDQWWTRQGLSVDDWLTQTRGYVTMNQPVHRVPDGLLWWRWDTATVRGRLIVAQEVLARGSRLQTAESVAEVVARPELLNEILEAGVAGGSTDRSVAADWVAAAGDDDHVVDFAAELQHLDDAQGLPRSLLDRLQRLSPDRLRPAALDTYVATHLDGSAPLDPAWRAHCLQLRLGGQLTCGHPEDLIRTSSQQELSDATRLVHDSGAPLETCWVNLAPLAWSQRATIVLASGSDAADFLLRREVTKTDAPAMAELVELWPRLARTASWSRWAQTLPAELDRRVRQLRAQRLVLLIAVGVLAVVAVVLGVL